METKLNQIKESYKDFSFRTIPVDKSNLQWKTIVDICQSLSSDAAILDAGCGDGRYVLGSQELGFQNVIGVDLFENIQDKSLKYIREDINHLSFKDQSFDFIYSVSVINYCENYERTLKEWYRVLRPGGLIMISGHTRYSVFTLIRMLKKLFFPNKYHHLQHLHFHDPNKIVCASTFIGFKIIKKDGFFISWLDRFTKMKMVSRFSDRFFSDRFRFNFGYHFVIVARKEK